MFRLAGHLSKSVEWIENNISSKELIEWLAFYEYIEPFGGRLVDEQRSALSIQNYQGENKPTLKDFFLYSYDMRTPEQIHKEAVELAKAKAEANSKSLKDFFKRKAVSNKQ